MKRRNKIVMTALTALFAMQVVACGGKTSGTVTPGSNTGEPLQVWGAYASAKILQDPAYNGNNTRLKAGATVYAARGEAESAQIVVTTGSDAVSAYTLETADLTNAAGDVYSKENVDVFFQHYVYVQRKSSNGTGNADYFPASVWTPDALIPQKYSVAYGENHIAANTNQGITFDFQVPVDTAPGTYTGTFTLKLDDTTQTIPVSLTVWDFDISKTNGINLWDIVDGYMSNGELNSSSDGLYYKYYDALLKYKLNAYHFYDEDGILVNARTADTWVATLRSYWKNPAFNGVFLPDIGGERDKINLLFERIGKACIEDGINYFGKIRFYHQSVDEPQYHPEINALGKCVEIVNNTNRILSDFARLITAYDGFDSLDNDLQTEITHSIEKMPQVVTTFYEAAEELKGLVNAYCPKIYEYESTYQRRMYLKNEADTDGETWVYTCIDPIYPYPSNHIDDFLLSGRVLKWMQKDYRIDAFLMWAVNAYSKNNDDGITDLMPINPYNDPRRVVIGVNGANGDGFMFYPMAKYEADEPIPSMRLLAARDGQEDYDTLCALETSYAANGTYYGVDKALDTFETAMRMYYEKLYTQVISNNDEVVFDRVRRSLGSMTEAAAGPTRTMVVQQRAANGASVSLRIYSGADEVYVDNNKLTKVGKYFLYGTTLADGANSVQIAYVKDGVTKSFEYFLPNRIRAYKLSEMDESKLWANTGSTAAVSGEKLEITAVSQGDKVSEIVSFELDVDVPLQLHYTDVDEFGFTVQNTCRYDTKFSVYLNAGARKLLVDTLIVYGYETYRYSLNHLYEWVGKLDAEVQGITLRFENADAQLKLLPDRTLAITDITYSLIG